MIVQLLTASLPVAAAGIPTAPGAEMGFPIWVLTTWGACLAFALWVIYVVIRDWNDEASEESTPDTMMSDGEASTIEHHRLAS